MQIQHQACKHVALVALQVGGVLGGLTRLSTMCSTLAFKQGQRNIRLTLNIQLLSSNSGTVYVEINQTDEDQVVVSLHIWAGSLEKHARVWAKQN